MGKIRIKQVSSGLTAISASPQQAGQAAVKHAPPAATPKKGKPTHPRAAHGRSRRYQKAAKLTAVKLRSSSSGAAPASAIALAKQTATASFTESIELHLTLAKPGLRATVTLPHPTGKKRTILILTASPDHVRASGVNTSGNLDIQIAGPEKIKQIKRLKSAPKVDAVWATPDIMAATASIANILGPAGLMPNPKHGTLIEKPEQLEKKLRAESSGTVTLETERKVPLIHTVLGTADAPAKQLTENLQAILAAFNPKSIKKATIASTMGPGIKLLLESKH